MKKIILGGLIFFLFSCKNKEVQLPKADKTIVANVLDNSTVYLFFETKGKDTLVDVNRKNSISSTNWLFVIDKSGWTFHSSLRTGSKLSIDSVTTNCALNRKGRINASFFVNVPHGTRVRLPAGRAPVHRRFASFRTFSNFSRKFPPRFSLEGWTSETGNS